MLGSTPFFWNWQDRYSEEVRDGQRHFLIGEFSNFMCPQLSCKLPRDAAMVREKVIPVRRIGYIEKGDVCSLVHYFHVLKGPDNIRMVYN